MPDEFRAKFNMPLSVDIQLVEDGEVDLAIESPIVNKFFLPKSYFEVWDSEI